MAKSIFPSIYCCVINSNADNFTQYADDIPDIEFFEQAVREKTCFTLEEFQDKFNRVEVNSNIHFIRFIEFKTKERF
jgi:hypothetical protein